MQDLFAHLPSPEPAADKGDILIAQVAVEQAVDRELDYLVPGKLRDLIAVGQRVKVPLGRGNRSCLACVIALKGHSDFALSKLKPISSIDDARSLLRPDLLDLARWMSRYYLTPLGTVLESMLPAAVKKRTGIGQITLVSSRLSHAQLRERMAASKRGKAAAVMGALLQLAEGEKIEITKLAAAANTTIATIWKMAGMGIITLIREADFSLPDSGEKAEHTPEAPLVFNAQQRAAYDAMLPLIAGGTFGIALLHGVTGSGKTEIYLQCIRHVLAAGRQAIVLVPEIALTPQTAQRFTRRFADVAVLHSGLTASDRHAQWRSIAAGKSRVVIGARSAVFAPVPNLGLIIIDEEHESSYKQETAPRYHARDVAIKRGQMRDVPIILGSATPSLEMYHRVRLTAGQQKADQPRTHHYLVLSSRATAQQQLPRVDLIDMKTANLGRPGIHLLSPQLEQGLTQTLSAGQQAIILLNRRGYASYIWCPSCGNQIKCKFCDVGMVYHRGKDARIGSSRSDLAVLAGTLHCHYCLATNPLPPACPDCGRRLSLFGLGTQRVEEELLRKFPDLQFARVDSDTMSRASDYERVLGDFAQGKVQMLMGTQMIAKGLDFPNVTFVGVISGDTALMLPDFRAAERTFQLITQVAGRAGRGEKPGKVIVQTYMPDDPTIRAAIRQDYNSFASAELEKRRQTSLPPFGRMIRVVFRDDDEKRALELAQAVGDKLKKAAAGISGVHVQGPMECSISRIAGQFRQQVVLTAPRAGLLQDTMAVLRKDGSIMKGDRIAIDVDPVSLL